MSLADFSEQDLDRLADYLADALEPTAAAEIAWLVRSEPAWSSAYAELAAADGQIREHLHAYGQAELVEPMPAEVIARVEAALAAEAGSSERAGWSLGAASSPASGGKVVSIDAARKARRRRLALVTAAASMVVAISFGLVALNGAGSSSPTAGSADSAVRAASGHGGAGAGADAGAPPPQAFTSAERLDPNIAITSSGRNYTAASIASADRLAPSPAPSAVPGTGGVQATGSKAAGPLVPSLDEQGARALARLNQADQLASCLGQITAAYPGRVVAVDYARYELLPALIVVVQQANGATVVVAAGDGCGLGGADVLGVGRP